LLQSFPFSQRISATPPGAEFVYKLEIPLEYRKIAASNAQSPEKEI
jgi:hypothetical protein